MVQKFKPEDIKVSSEVTVSSIQHKIMNHKKLTFDRKRLFDWKEKSERFF